MQSSRKLTKIYLNKAYYLPLINDVNNKKITDPRMAVIVNEDDGLQENLWGSFT
jgi:hypothetical protein